MMLPSPMRGRVASLVVVVAVALGAAPSLDGKSRAAAPPRAEVTIDNFAFAPATLTVARGTTVKWTNKDDEPHTVVSDRDPKLFKSPALDTDESFSFTFNDPGTYKYYCTIHPHMQGTIVVQ
jgi:plastocyanin